jgi:hypothetical protein
MQAELSRYKQRLQTLDTTEPLFFHGSADIEDYRLRPEVEPATPGQHRGRRWHLPE